ncbi:MAG: acetyl-CoA hydrolase/transferase family protein [Acidimicrobiales bacterium]
MPDTDYDFGPYLAASRGRRAARWTSAEEAVRAIPEGARVFVAASSMTPQRLLSALDDERARWRKMELVMAYMTSRPAPFEHPGEPFTFLTTQATPAFKHLWATGTVGVLPCRYSDLAGLFVPGGPLPCDAALLHVSRPGPDGRVSMGLSTGANVDVARSAPLVIALVNPNVPYTFGAGEMPVEEFDYLVECDDPIPVARYGEEADEIGRTIAEMAAAFVPEQATIQFGVGALPDATLNLLKARRGLRVHSGMLTEACRELYEAGAVEGPMIAAEVVSTPAITRWVDRNPAVLMGPARFTHGAPALGRLTNFVAINSTVEVALDGACNSEVAGGQIISGPGGAPDYAFGASVASGGRSIIALRSTAGRGKVSRVVRGIEPPNPVTLPPYTADIIITEHGSVEVRGLTTGQRAEAIRALAHPDHRAALA